MKTTFLKQILPAMTFVIAMFGAFAFSKAPVADEEAVAQFLGHYKAPNGRCVSAEIMCQDDIVTTPCSTSAQPALYKYVNPTSCPNQLWKIE